MVNINLGYNTSIIVTKEEAFLLVGILERAYTWEEQWVPKDRSNTGESHYLYYAYPQENSISMKLVHDRVFEMAKLAGKPDTSKS
jgi:hypothetical protein